MPKLFKLNTGLLFLLLWMQGTIYAQHTKYGKLNGYSVGGVKLTAKEEALAAKYNTCYNNHKYTARQRGAFFPFNSSAAIKLISFSLSSDVNDPTDNAPAVFTPVAPGYYKLNNSRVKESKTLSASAIDSLTDIMYNVGYTPVKLSFRISDPGASCYNPHNAILFTDAQGTVNQYIELCFECQRYYLSSSKIKNTVYCDQKYELLKTFFLSQGIKYGTERKE